MGKLRAIFSVILALTMIPAGMALAEGETTYDLHFDNTAWLYNADDDVYWQVGVVYCQSPAAVEYESLGIFVPGAYMTATDNGDGTYTCSLNAAGEVAGYTASTAPIVIPVNTPGYSAMAAPTGYASEAAAYTTAGLIYVSAGCRGRANGSDESGNLTYEGGAPWGVTDLKAAILYLRYNASSLPGDAARVFSFGMSGGGAQSALLGATGDSALYAPYLAAIGAAAQDDQGDALSDAVLGAMCWCPITSLDEADEAYEWNMGQYADDGTRADGTFTKALSNDLAAAYAQYLNVLGLVDENGNALTLTESTDGIYAAGSYYDYLVSEVETSLNNFLSDTAFPYTEGGSEMSALPDGSGEMGDAPTGQADQRPGRNGGPGADGTDANTSATAKTDGAPDANATGMPENGGPGADGTDANTSATAKTDSAPDANATGTPENGGPGADGTDANTSATAGTTYETVQDYIDSLNADSAWVSYDAATGTASITSLADFVTHMKNATKDVGAFDDLNLSEAENDLFGTGESDLSHFDSTLAALLAANESAYAGLTGWDASYVVAYADDLQAVDSLGNSVQSRVDMYNPMYYLSAYYDGAGTSTVAKYWRIRTGIEQGDTALTVETNLALALQANADVADVDFATVWGQGHAQAERTGDAATNFIAWVSACCAE